MNKEKKIKTGLAIAVAGAMVTACTGGETGGRQPCVEELQSALNPDKVFEIRVADGDAVTFARQDNEGKVVAAWNEVCDDGKFRKATEGQGTVGTITLDQEGHVVDMR
jgi:plastocyanin